MTTFTKVGSTFVEQKFPLTLYKSDFSGCKVVIVDYASPFVDAEFTIATVHENDYGIAHALEHLIFEGSKNYPYGSLLFNIANKAGGFTNASTNADNTVIELSTMGFEGFIKVLPAYLDSIFNPLLHESKFKTEVHHINGEGMHGGVVYSEMLKDNRCLRLNKLIYGKDSPLARSIGGSPKDIRENCTLDRIKEFHEKYYKMENMFITIVGTVSHDKVLAAVTAFERSNNFVKTENFRIYKPEEISPFKQTVDRHYYNSNCKTGYAKIRWRGPNIWDNETPSIFRILCYLAMEFKARYIDSKISVCVAKDVYFRKQNQIAVFGLDFNHVKEEYLKEDSQVTIQELVLKMVRSHKVNLKAMRENVIRYHIKGAQEILENDVTSIVFDNVRCYQNYGPEVSFEEDNVELIRENSMDELRQMLEYDADYWQNLMTKYFTEDYIVLIHLPIAEQICDDPVNEDGPNMNQEQLKKYGLELEEAVAANKARKAPEEFYDQFTVKNIEDISVAPAKRSVSFQTFGKSTAPMIVHKTDSTMLHLKLIFECADIPESYRPLVPLFIDLTKKCCAPSKAIFVFPAKILQNKFVIDFSECDEGDNISIWINAYFYETRFDEAIIKQLLEHYIRNMNSGRLAMNAVLYTLHNHLTYISGIVPNEIADQKFYSQLLENMGDADFLKELIARLKKLGEYIRNAQFNLHAIGNPKIIDSLSFEQWPSFKGSTILRTNPHTIYDYSRCSGKTYCVAQKDWNSSSFRQVVHAQFDLDSTQFVYSLLLSEYFCQSSGGPLFDAVRGNGFAYSVFIHTYLKLGIIMEITEASNLIAAVRASKKVVTDVITSRKLDVRTFNRGKSRAVYKVLNGYSTITTVGSTSFADYFDGCGLEEDLVRIHVKMINDATPQAVLQTVGKYYLDLFDDSKNIKTMVVPFHTKEAIQEAFKNVEFKSIEDFYRDIPLPKTSSIRRWCNARLKRLKYFYQKMYSFFKTLTSRIGSLW